MEKRENRKQWPLTILISYLVLILADVVCGISLRFSFCFFLLPMPTRPMLEIISCGNGD
jgi:hypothetical protein